MTRKHKLNIVPRDLDLLKFCYDHYFLTRNQIKTWFLVKETITNQDSLRSLSSRFIEFFQRQKLVEINSSWRLINEPLYAPSKAGVGILKQSNLLPKDVNYQHFDQTKSYHDYLLTETRLLLEKILPIAGWIPDRYFQPQTKDPIPDAVMELYSPKVNRRIRIAMELELSTKSKSRYREKFRFYHNSPDYDIVFYFVQDESLKDLILRISKECSNVIYVTLADDLLQKQQECEFVANDDKFILKECVS